MRSIALVNQKGGVGKSTTAVNLSAGLARLGKRVLLIDLDPQAHATVALGLEPRQLDCTVYSLLAGTARPEEVIRKLTDNLSIIPANIHLAGGEAELAAMPRPHFVLKNAMERVDASQYDFCIIDSPPQLGFLNVNSLAWVKDVYIPVTCEFYALHGLSLLMDTVERVRAKLNPDLRIAGVITTQLHPRRAITRDVLADLERHFPGRLLKTRIRINVRLVEAPSHGQSIFDYAPESNGAIDYMNLSKELLERLDMPATPIETAAPAEVVADAPAPVEQAMTEPAVEEAVVETPVDEPAPAEAVETAEPVQEEPVAIEETVQEAPFEEPAPAEVVATAEAPAPVESAPEETIAEAASVEEAPAAEEALAAEPETVAERSFEGRVLEPSSPHLEAPVQTETSEFVCAEPATPIAELPEKMPIPSLEQPEPAEQIVQEALKGPASDEAVPLSVWDSGSTATDYSGTPDSAFAPAESAPTAEPAPAAVMETAPAPVVEAPAPEAVATEARPEFVCAEPATPVAELRAEPAADPHAEIAPAEPVAEAAPAPAAAPLVKPPLAGRFAIQGLKPIVVAGQAPAPVEKKKGIGGMFSRFLGK